MRELTKYITSGLLAVLSGCSSLDFDKMSKEKLEKYFDVYFIGEETNKKFQDAELMYQINNMSYRHYSEK